MLGNRKCTKTLSTKVMSFNSESTVIRILAIVVISFWMLSNMKMYQPVPP